MDTKQVGFGTIKFDKVTVCGGYTVAGKKESRGKLDTTFDLVLPDDRFGETTFEKAECKMFMSAIKGVLEKTKLADENLDVVIGGDLLNQIISTSFSMRGFDTPFIGLYNACATFVESLILASIMIDGGYKNNIIGLSGSHFSTAERQYRYPLELGVLRSPVTQWTATGVGASLVSNNNISGIKITRATIGKVIDYGIKDANNMGAAMAPAARDTLLQFFKDTNATPYDYDMIFTGDLGKLGKTIFIDLMEKEGYDLKKNYDDCGAMLFLDEQKTYQGGSGAACSALVFNSYILNKLANHNYKKILLIGTGALMSPLTAFQGESIPAIAHLIEVKVEDTI